MAAGFCCANTVRAGARPCRRAMAANASDVCRAGYRIGHHAAAEAVPAIDEELDAGRGRIRREARVVGGTFVAHLRRGGQRLVHGEMRGVGKDRAQDRGGRRRLERAMEMRDEIRRREVHAPVRRIGRRADGGRIGHPHRGGGRARGQQRRRVRAARRRIAASSPANPNARNAGRKGRSCGGSTACGNPRAASARILASPCSAASRGLATSPALCSEATLPVARPE